MSQLSSNKVLFWFCFSDGFENYQVDLCEFTSPDLKDIEFSRSLVYNKKEFCRFSSSLGKFVGYTEWGIYQANYFNNLTGYIQGLRADKERYCLNHVGIAYSAVLTKSGECLCLISS
uniref:MHC class II beta chain N-terminal domain-containing protein n=1 Tax=Cyprinodon variegatus TaxID=28743 RepID=A0A3Q2CM92_CYPVA